MSKLAKIRVGKCTKPLSVNFIVSEYIIANFSLICIGTEDVNSGFILYMLIKLNMFTEFILELQPVLFIHAKCKNIIELNLNLNFI